MKKKPRIALGYWIAVLFAVALAVLHFIDAPIADRLGKEFTAFSGRLLVFIPCLFVLIGLLDAWLPMPWIQKHLGEQSGRKGAFFVILLAMFQGGPLYAAFPVAHLLRQKGCSLRNVFIYLGAFSSLKLPLMFFEASFLGWRFTLLRALVALPVFLMIAEVMDIYARKRGFDVQGPAGGEGRTVPEKPDEQALI
ncbi:MAG: permease [Opitutales bacterium]